MIAMRTNCFLRAAAVLLLAGISCSRTPYKPVLSVKDLMDATIEPNADGVFNSAVWVNGAPTGVPTTDADWEVVEHQALTLAEAANLLMMPGRAKDSGPWMDQALSLQRVAMAAAKAAQTKSIDEMFKAGGPIDVVCDNCHKLYPPSVVAPTSPMKQPRD
jgi:hypothetical protein